MKMPSFLNRPKKEAGDMLNVKGHDQFSELRKKILDNALNGTGAGILLNENDVFIRASQDEAQKIIDEAQEASKDNEDLDKAAEIFGTVATTHMKVGGRRRKSKKKRSRRKKKTRRRRRRSSDRSATHGRRRMGTAVGAAPRAPRAAGPWCDTRRSWPS